MDSSSSSASSGLSFQSYSSSEPEPDFDLMAVYEALAPEWWDERDWVFTDESEDDASLTDGEDNLQLLVGGVVDPLCEVAPTKCVSLDCEFTIAKPGSQKDLPLQHRQHIASLARCSSSILCTWQCSVAGPQGIPWGVVIGNNLKMLEYYNLAAILGAHDLQRIIPNPTKNCPPSLYDLSNHYVGKKLVKNPHNSIRCDNWSEFPLDYDQLKYATLDAHINFIIARKQCHLVGYDSIMDHLNVEMM
nr:uncharacterized protein LOC127339039 [Lolium perenne]